MAFEKIEPGIWKAEKEGDEIVGVLVRVQDSSKFDNKVYHLEVKKEEGTEQFVVFGTKVLDDRMSYIHEGDIVKIVYKGIEKNLKGQPTKIFEVWKDTPESFERDQSQPKLLETKQV